MPDFIKNASPILNQIIARFPKPKYTILLLQLCALAYFVLAVIGGIKNFSPVPHWDGWAALEFFTEISNGWNFDSLWHQHNEHRIALSRMLFWIDIAIFHGTSVFLIIFNYIFALTAFVIFFFCAKESLKNEQPETLNLISAAILILLFLWIQSASPQAIHILNSSVEVIGYALSGEIRKDIKNELGKKSATNSGFRGFFLKKTLGKKVILQGLNPDCTLEIALPL